MEKKSFLIYLGVGFLMTFGLWSLMGGFSKKKTDPQELTQISNVTEEVLLPEIEEKMLAPKEEVVAQVENKVESFPLEPIKSVKKEPVKEVETFIFVEKQKRLNYKVVKGDSLWKISQKYRTSIEEIMELNHLKSMSIRVGQKLKIDATVQVKKKTGPIKVVQKKKIRVREEPQKTEKVQLAPKKRDLPKKKILKREIVKKEPVKVEVAKKEIKQDVALEKTVVELKPVEVVANPKKEEERQEPYTGELLTYEVKDGESLIQIAELYKTSHAFLLDINGLIEKSELQAGQILLVPEK